MKFNSMTSLALQATLSVAQMATYSPSQDNAISYAVNVPSADAQSGSGDIYIQIKGPVSGSNARSWIAIGQGSGMPGANIFVVYPNSAGNNVTLSPRLASNGYNEPSYTNVTQAELLDGTGIENGILTANIKCSNCNSWSGGSMSYTDSSSNWIWSSAAYGAINSDDTSLGINMHNERGEFTFDLTKATGGSSSDPFTSSTSTTGSSGSGSGSSGNGASGGSSGPGGNSGSSGSSSGSSAGGYGPSGDFAKLPMITTAHAAVMSLAFLFFYPMGAIIMRIGIGGATLWTHAALQGFAWLLAIAGLGLGVWMAMTLDYFTIVTPHVIIGLIVVCVLVLQAPLGLLHHHFYKKRGGRTGVSHAHIWLGRALMTLGTINGGLGLQLAGNDNPSGTIAYGVVAGIVYVGYFALVAGTFGKGKRSAARAQDEKARRSDVS